MIPQNKLTEHQRQAT